MSNASLIGNLNGIALASWSKEEVHEQVKKCVRAAAPGGGYILSDHHGEIPFQVSDETLFALVETVREYGTYPVRGRADV